MNTKKLLNSFNVEDILEGIKSNNIIIQSYRKFSGFYIKRFFVDFYITENEIKYIKKILKVISIEEFKCCYVNYEGQIRYISINNSNKSLKDFSNLILNQKRKFFLKATIRESNKNKLLIQKITDFLKTKKKIIKNGMYYISYDE